jgi:hypothetical protein
MKIPFFERGDAEDGYTNEQFSTCPALVAAAAHFAGTTEELVNFVGRQVKA